MRTLPQDIEQMIRYKEWGKFTRDEKLSLVNCAITDIYMDEDFKPDKRHQAKISVLNQLRKVLIADNWVKPKYDD